MAKYELTDQTKVIKHPLTGVAVTLRRIRALESFVNLATGLPVSPGDLGGWVEQGRNLAQEGTCWLFDDACAFDHSFRSGDSAGSGTSH